MKKDNFNSREEVILRDSIRPAGVFVRMDEQLIQLLQLTVVAVVVAQG